MATCKMNETKLEVSENYEEAELSDVEDDVFIRSSGKNGLRMEFDIAKKPLMNPRKKQPYNFDNFKNGGFHTDIRTSSASILRVICVPVCYILIALFAMLGLIAVVAFLLSYTPWPLSIIKNWPWRKNLTPVPCDQFKVEDVWIKKFPKLLTESAFRLLDVNQDGIEDIIFGFATGVDGYGIPEFVCDIYIKPDQRPCFGGVLALDGRDGSELWRHWANHEVFAINCEEDITQDNINDCLIGGRAGVFCAINGKNGSLIWTFKEGPAKNPIMNIYTPQYIRDLNEDGILDVLAIHGGDPLSNPGSQHRLSGRILLVDGKNGDILNWVGNPDKKESYYSPQIITRPDGTDFLLFGTGGETHGGSLFIISISDLYKGFIENAKPIYTDDQKGVMVPPILTDINGDGIEDIVMAMFNSTVVAFDGDTYSQIWNHTFPSSETYVTPTPGYFNEDNVPDFLVKYQVGPGFPLYFHAKTTVLSGSDGKPILQNPIIDSIGSQASTPLIRVEGLGNDIFLYWSSNCKGYEGNSTEFAFLKGTNVHEQSRSDFCKIRFDSSLINQLRIFNRQIGEPGYLVYDSDERKELEYNGSIDTSLEGQNYLKLHPEMWNNVGKYDKFPKDKFQKQQDILDERQQQEQQQPDPSSYNNRMSENLPFDQMGRFPISPQSQDMSGPGLSIPILSPQENPFNPFVMRPIQNPYSQPELTEEVKYPFYHSVRKHGQLHPPPPPLQKQNQAELPINIIRRQEGQYNNNHNSPNDDIWENLYRSNVLGPASAGRYPMEYPENKFYGNNNHFANNRGQYTQGEANRRQTQNYFDPSQRIRDLRAKRHIGPHDASGIQRLISTGTLSKPLNGNGDGIDFIFATYWFFPSQTQAILEKDRDCIQEKMSQESQRFDENSKYSGMDHDQYEEFVTAECLKRNGDEDETDRIYQSQSSYNPFDIHMGQMTVYRIRITCSCERKLEKDQTCGKILPMDEQPWSAYMGSKANSYFNKFSTNKEEKRP